jgi:hypothetical protein
MTYQIGIYLSFGILKYKILRNGEISPNPVTLQSRQNDVRLGGWINESVLGCVWVKRGGWGGCSSGLGQRMLIEIVIYIGPYVQETEARRPI